MKHWTPILAAAAIIAVGAQAASGAAATQPRNDQVVRTQAGKGLLTTPNLGTTGVAPSTNLTQQAPNGKLDLKNDALPQWV